MNKQEAWKYIKELSRDEFNNTIKEQRLADDRKDLLFDFIQGVKQINYACVPDVQAYALKSLLPDVFNRLPKESHPYANTDLLEYEPWKNGQNIVKHGISFSEVISYSPRFGTLMVPVPHEVDGERLIIFSDLVLDLKRDRLALPPKEIKELNYVVSVTKQKVGKFRFISSRFLSSKPQKYRKNIEQIIGEVVSDNSTRSGFVSACIEIIETRLLRRPTFTGAA